LAGGIEICELNAMCLIVAVGRPVLRVLWLELSRWQVKSRGRKSFWEVKCLWLIYGVRSYHISCGMYVYRL